MRTIRLELRDYSWERSGWDPGDPIHDVVRYDRNGRCLTSDMDPGSGWRAYGLPLPPVTAARAARYELVRKPRKGREIGWKTVWLFDNEGRLGRFESYALYDHGPSLANWHQYTYDSQGRVAELTYWANWGWSPNQTEPYPPIRIKYWFDNAGRIGGWVEADDPNKRTSLTYDSEGRLVKQLDENADGYVTIQTWGGYDRHGNWTIRTNTRSWRTEDGDEPQSQEVIRRSITYRRSSK